MFRCGNWFWLQSQQDWNEKHSHGLFPLHLWITTAQRVRKKVGKAFGSPQPCPLVQGPGATQTTVPGTPNSPYPPLSLFSQLEMHLPRQSCTWVEGRGIASGEDWYEEDMRTVGGGKVGLTPLALSGKGEIGKGQIRDEVILWEALDECPWDSEFWARVN